MEEIFLSKIKKIAKEAGDILMRHRDGDLDVKTKADDCDFVTNADKESDKFIRDKIKELFPGDKILSEETESSIIDFSGRVWIIDPLDGTKYYISGGDTFSVMIGLAVEGRSYFGLVYSPVFQTYYWAQKDRGAWKQDSNGNIIKLSVNEVLIAENLQIVVSPMYTGLREKDLFVSSELSARDYVRIASGGLKTAKIAEGLADMTYYPYDNTGKWDFCASDILIQEAGGMFTDTDGNFVNYAVSNDKFPKTFICSNGKIHSQLLEKYKEYIKR